MKRLALCVLAVSMAGCTPDHEINRNMQYDTFYQEPSNAVDILWVVDDSISMEDEQEKMAARFSTFIAHIEETNIDFHIGVVTTDMDPDNDARAELVGDPPYLTSADDNYELLFHDRVQVGTEGSDKEQGLEAAYQAVTEPYVSDANAGFLRSDAVLSLIFVSDEDDCSHRGGLGAEPTNHDCYASTEDLVPVKDYISDFKVVKDSTDKIMASSIVGPKAADGCQETVPGHRYWDLAEGLGGMIADICANDYEDIMSELGLSASGVRSSFQLTYSPIEESLEVYIDESLILNDPVDGWTYDDETGYVSFHGESVPPRDSVITIAYEVGG